MTEPRFTGERFIPGHGGADIAYEHIHRYLFAARLAAGKRVLDLACGSGYGAALLAQTAEGVVGIDLDVESLRHAARSGPRGPALVAGDGTKLPLRDRSFDVVTAFEVVEHVAGAETLVSEISRVLRRDGLALISTPDKALYSDARNYRNPFHVREFYPHEFLALLRERFPVVRDLRQQVRAGSLIDAAESGSGAASGPIDCDPAPGGSGGKPMYLLAVCGCSEESGLGPGRSAYLDTGDALIGEWALRLQMALDEIAKLNREIGGLGEWGRRLEAEVALRDETLRETMRRSEAEVAARDGVIVSVREEMAREIGRRDTSLEELRAEFDSRTDWVQSLEREVGVRDERIREALGLLDRTSAVLARVQGSLLYRVLRRLRLLPG